MPEFRFDGNLVIINICIVLFLLYRYNKTFRCRPESINTNYSIPLLCTILYSVFAFAEADTYHYMWIFDSMISTKKRVHVEPFYFWLTNYISNYYLWRLVIWGTATVLYFRILKKIRIDSTTIGFFLPILFYYQFSLTRGSLGFSILMLSILNLLDRPNSIIRIFLSIIGLVLASLLHRSISVFMIAVPFAFLMPLNKRTIRISLFAFPLLYGIIYKVPDFLFNYIHFGEDTLSQANIYLNQNKAKINIFGILRLLWNWSGYLLCMFICLHSYINKQVPDNRYIKFCLKYGYILVYISFLFFGQEMSSFISSRALHASVFPLLISTCYCYQYLDRTNLNRCAMFLLTSYCIYNLVYFFIIWR